MMASRIKMIQQLVTLAKVELDGDPEKVTLAWVRKHFKDAQGLAAVNVVIGVKARLGGGVKAGT
jgi:hypothetical protein